MEILYPVQQSTSVRRMETEYTVHANTTYRADRDLQPYNILDWLLDWFNIPPYELHSRPGPRAVSWYHSEMNESRSNSGEMGDERD